MQSYIKCFTKRKIRRPAFSLFREMFSKIEMHLLSMTNFQQAQVVSCPDFYLNAGLYFLIFLQIHSKPGYRTGIGSMGRQLQRISFFLIILNMIEHLHIKRHIYYCPYQSSWQYQTANQSTNKQMQLSPFALSLFLH